MKFYDSLGPNPRLVRMFLLEKSVTVPTEQVDIMSGANRKAPYTDKNPAGQMPAGQLGRQAGLRAVRGLFSP